jgi:cytochrome P450
VLQDQSKHFSKQTRGYAVLRRLLGNGLVTSEGEFWLRQRRIAQPGFHRQRIAHFAQTMTSLTQDLTNRWDTLPEGTELDMASEMMALTLRIVGRTLLGAEVGTTSGVVGPSLSELLHQMTRRTTALLDLPDWIPTPMNLRERKAKKALNDVVYRLIEDRRKSGEHSDDLLSMLMDARDEETGEGMTDAQLRDEVMTLFLAGHETTANALTWTFYLLSGHPDVARKLHEEVTSVLAGRMPTLEDLPKLKYTQAVIQESMRLFPPVWIIMRRAEQDENIGGFHIPAQSFIACSPYLSHRDPNHFTQPDVFDPERFLNGKAELIPKFAYYPFSGGPRICIGNTFAQMEAQLVLAMVSQRYAPQVRPGFEPDPEPTVTLRPRHGLPMRLSRH